MMPGLGQIYLGAYFRGVGLFVAFIILAVLPEARLLLPLAALLAAAEVGRFKGARVWVGSGIWEGFPQWAKPLQRAFETSAPERKSRAFYYTVVGIVGFSGWMMLFAPSLYPFHFQSQINEDVERIADKVRIYRDHNGKLPGTSGEFFEGRAPSNDPWGSAYAVEADGSGFSVRSNGPDKQGGTRDDFIFRFR